MTIGRNIEDGPMPADTWESFVNDTRATLAPNVAEWWVDASYDGLWEGTSEDAWVFYGPFQADVREEDINDLTGKLRDLAALYFQEAIGLMVGDSVLVEPVPAYVREMVS